MQVHLQALACWPHRRMQSLLESQGILESRVSAKSSHPVCFYLHGVHIHFLWGMQWGIPAFCAGCKSCYVADGWVHVGFPLMMCVCITGWPLSQREHCEVGLQLHSSSVLFQCTHTCCGHTALLLLQLYPCICTKSAAYYHQRTQTYCPTCQLAAV